MITCPNLSNPTVKAQWDAIANNPALGNREAMREFMEAEMNNRPIGTPEQVMAKLEAREVVNPIASHDKFVADMKNIIAAKSNDPVLTDPDTLYGFASVVQPINTKSLSVTDNSNGRAMEVLNKLSEATGINYSFITPEEAVIITANSKNPYTIGRAPAFFHGGTVYFINGMVNTELAFHEFAHPIVRTIQQDNPVLFEKLYMDAIRADQTLLDEAIAEYQDLQKALDNAVEDEEKDAIRLKLQKAVAEEVIVKALTRGAMLKEAGIKPSTGLAKALNNILAAIKKMLRSVFGNKVNVAKLDETTSLDKLAEMLHAGGNFVINTETVSQADVVAYNQDFQNYVNDLKQATEGDKGQAVMAMARRIYEGATDQIEMIMKNKNYQEMINLFADQYNRGDLQEMRANVSRYARELETKAESMIEDIQKTQSQVQSVVGAMLRLKVMMTKMEEHLNELRKDATNRDNVHRAYYYARVLEYWQKYISEAQDMMIKAGAKSDSPMNQLLGSIETSMKTSAKHINQMNNEGISDILWEQWESMSNRAEELFKDKIKRLEDRNASQAAINKEYVKFYGMNKADYERYKMLQAKQESGQDLTYEESKDLEIGKKASFDGIVMSREKVARAIRGEGADARYIESYFEGYLYSSDPVIGGFALYFKNNMTEMEARVQSRVSGMSGALKELIDDAGINFLKPGELGKKIGFVDKFGYIDKNGTFQQKEVWAMLNPYKDYRYDVDRFNNELKGLRDRYNRDRSKENQEAFAAKLAEKNAHMRKWMQQEYVDEYYEKDDLLGKDASDTVGQRAKFLRDEIFNRMEIINLAANRDDQLVDNTKEMDDLWKEYNQLYSSYYLNGQKKTGVDLEVAQRLQQHRDLTRKFHEYKPRTGVYENELAKKEQQIRDNLISLQYEEGTEEFDDQFEAYRDMWIKANTVTKIKPEFYEIRSKLIENLKEILGRPAARLRQQLKDLEAKGIKTAADRALKKDLEDKLVSADTKAKKTDFTESFKTILDIASGYRDSDGQPIGSDMLDERKAVIKEAQEEMENARNEWAGYSGLTRDEMELLIDLSKKKKENGELEPNEFEKFKELLNRQDSLGLTKNERAEITGLFGDLRELQTKDPTTYYVDAINHWMDIIDSQEVYDELNFNEFNASNMDKLYNPSVLSKMFAKSPEFEKWFKANHLEKNYRDKDAKSVTSYERLYVWNIIKPNDPNMYETKPSLKYFTRVVKKEYKNGYDKNTGEVKLIIGVHKDNRGEWLPKQDVNSPYYNQAYFDLQKNDPKLFKLLEFLKEEHLKSQDGLSKRGKLYYDFPRYGMSGLEAAQAKGIKGTAAEKLSPISAMLTKIKQFFTGAMDEQGSIYNADMANELVRADGFNDQIENIPMQGLFNLELKDTSTDVISGILRYIYNAEHHKQLVKMNPIAQGLKNLLEDPNNKLKELDKINRSNFINFGATTYANKKGKYIRKDAIAQYYERDFQGQSITGFGKDIPWIQNVQRHLFGKAAFSFFAFNIPSALKNMFTKKFQSLILASAGNDLTVSTLFKGESWSMKYMMKLSGSDIYAKGPKSLEHQIGEIFDPSPNRFQEKFHESITRTFAKDVVSTGWFYNFRKWTEVQATMQTFAGMMFKKKIPMGNQMIDYMDAWELNAQGKIQLKAGIDPTWGITYDEEGNMSVGAEFKAFKNKVGAVNTKLDGAFAKLDQPLMQRLIAFRFVQFLKKHMITMSINRFGRNRMAPGYGQEDEGYYVQAVKSLLGAIKNRNINDMTREDRAAWMRIITEVGVLYLMGLLMGPLFGWDEDDEDRYKKLREKSGKMTIPFLADEEPGQEFNLAGFMELHAMNQMLQIRSENEQFIPWPGMGLDNLSTVVDLKSLAFGPTTDTWQRIGTDLVNIWEGNERQFYKRRSGPFNWSQQGGRQIWAHIGKMFGVTGSNISPGDMITNWDKAQNMSAKR